LEKKKRQRPDSDEIANEENQFHLGQNKVLTLNREKLTNPDLV